MLTVLESLNLSTEYLEKKGIDSARTNAELLLSSILKCKRLDLYLSFNRPLSETEIDLYRDFVARRGKFEPFQYILGEVEFHEITLKVNKHVLIPRPETEILVEKIINSFSKEDKLKILDIGTGSGNIALSIAKGLPNSKLLGIDISDEAVKLALENANMNQLVSRVEFKNIDVFKINVSEYNEEFDVVVSNPPYVSLEEYPTLQKEIIHFEPDFALTDRSDGYKFYEHITNLSTKILKKGGMLFYEIGKGQTEKVVSIMEKNSFSNIITDKDYSDIDRVIRGVNK